MWISWSPKSSESLSLMATCVPDYFANLSFGLQSWSQPEKRQAGVESEDTSLTIICGGLCQEWGSLLPWVSSGFPQLKCSSLGAALWPCCALWIKARLSPAAQGLLKFKLIGVFCLPLWQLHYSRHRQLHNCVTCIISLIFSSALAADVAQVTLRPGWWLLSCLGAQRAPRLGDSWEPEHEEAWELIGCRHCFPGSKLLRKLKLQKFGLEVHM